jgi:hypothetical protein
MKVELMLEHLEELEEELMVRSFLYQHPASFREGVEASFHAVRAVLGKLAGRALEPTG